VIFKKKKKKEMGKEEKVVLGNNLQKFYWMSPVVTRE